MSDGILNWPLQDDEVILWEGRPVPRCYTFRHWLQATIGTILFFACSFWLMVGIQLVRSQNYSRWLIVAPLLLTFAAFFVGPGQLLLARWRWEKIFYTLTSQRLLVRNKLFGHKISTYLLSDYRHNKQKKYGRQLASIRLSFQNCAPVILECLEYPQNFLDCLSQQNESQ